MQVESLLLLLLSIIGTLVILLFKMISEKIDELKKEIKIIQHIENRVTILETIIFKNGNNRNINKQ